MRFDLKISTNLQDYPSSLRFMEERVQGIQQGFSSPLLWLLEYPSLFTDGRNSREKIISPTVSLPVWEASRGGKMTYHGPGQRILYLMMSLKPYGKDVKLFVYFLEEWVIEALSHLGIKGKRAEGRTGVWVDTPTGEKKIAALGVRLQKWVSSHGVSLNVANDLKPYDAIIPCGIAEYGVTSLKELGVQASMEAIDQLLLETFPLVFERVMKGVIHGFDKS